MINFKQFPGSHITRVADQLCLGGFPLSELAKSFGTPLYVYDFDRIKKKSEYLIRELSQVSGHSRAFFAMKALSNLSVLKTIHNAGLGMDVVSGGEIERAIAAGVNGNDIVFSGVAKTADEIRLGIAKRIACFNIESPHEVDKLLELTIDQADPVHVALRINPDIDSKTHAKINTGLADTKFGLSPHQAKALAQKILASSTLRLSGISCHIGSQITNLDTIKSAAMAMRAFAEELLSMGAPLSHIDMGGGLAVAYRTEEAPTVPSFREWVDAARLALPNDSMDLYLEPGRSIVGDAGILLARIIDLKAGERKTFAIIDAGMTELIRPALYDAHHEIKQVTSHHNAQTTSYTVVGPVCETSCLISQAADLAELEIGDLLAVLNAGAYGMTMASNYNSRPRAAEVAVENGAARLIRRREKLSALWDAELFDR